MLPTVDFDMIPGLQTYTVCLHASLQGRSGGAASFASNWQLDSLGSTWSTSKVMQMLDRSLWSSAQTSKKAQVWIALTVSQVIISQSQ